MILQKLRELIRDLYIEGWSLSEMDEAQISYDRTEERIIIDLPTRGEGRR